MADNLIRIVMQTQGASKVSGDFQTLQQRAKELNISMTNLRRGIRDTETVFTGEGEAVNRITAQHQDLNKVLSAGSRQARMFRMEYLSLMFGAQIASRQIQRVMTSSISAFQEIATETNEANQTLAAFGAQFTFLKFTIGQAIAQGLAPFLPIFTDIVERMVDFIEQHPEETFYALAGAFALFSAIAISASALLFLNGLKQVFGTSAIADNAFSLQTALGGIARIAAGGIGAFLIIRGVLNADEKPIRSLADLVAGTALMRFAYTGKLTGGVTWAIGIAAVLYFVDDPEGVSHFLGKLFGRFLRFAYDISQLVARQVIGVLGEAISKVLGIFIDTSSIDNWLDELSSRQVNPFGLAGAAFAEGANEGFGDEIDFFGKTLKAEDIDWYETFSVPQAQQVLEQDIPNSIGKLTDAISGDQEGSISSSLMEARVDIENFGNVSEEVFTNMSNSVIGETDRIIERLNSIPREIDVTVNVTERGAGGTLSRILRAI